MEGQRKLASFFMRQFVLLLLLASTACAGNRIMPPAKVKIALHTWTLEPVPGTDFECGEEKHAIGCTDFETLTIRYVQGMPLSTEQVVIWHEVKHAAMSMGIRNVQVIEEGCVELGASLELETVQDNPDLVKYLLQK